MFDPSLAYRDYNVTRQNSMRGGAVSSWVIFVDYWRPTQILLYMSPLRRQMLRGMSPEGAREYPKVTEAPMTIFSCVCLARRSPRRRQ